MKSWLFAFIYILGTASSTAWASPLYQGWTSVRALGMGNAYVAVVEDGDSLFYNPAGFCRASGFNFKIFDLMVGLDTLDAQGLQSQFSNNSNTTALLESLYGKNYWLGAGASSILYLPCLGLGIFGNGDVSINLSNPAYSTLSLGYITDYGAGVGFGLPIIPKFFYLGFSSRYIIRTGTTYPMGPEILSTLDTTTIQANLADKGKAYSFDAGLIFQIPAGVITPAIGFVYKNIGQTTFSFDSGVQAPPPIQDEMDIGASVTVDALIASITPSIEYKFMNRYDIQWPRKVHAGVEVSLPLVSLRAGINEGYYTAGVGMDLLLLRVDAATYGVELGNYPGQMQDRRYVVQVTAEFGFDPTKFLGFGSSSVTNPDGSISHPSRRLKQRR